MVKRIKELLQYTYTVKIIRNKGVLKILTAKRHIKILRKKKDIYNVDLARALVGRKTVSFPKGML